jgi:GT2 family glycosyltransferase
VSASPAAAIVVPTRNRPELLAATLASLLAQDLPRASYEIVVVDDGSEFPASVPAGVTLVRHEQSQGPNAARNAGIAAARADLVCLIDDDIAAPAGWLREYVHGAQRHPDAWCLGGPVRLQLDDVTLRTCRYCRGALDWESEFEPDEPEGTTAENVIGANMAIRRDALAAAGPFDEDRPQYGEEFEWQDRAREAGGRVVYLPAAWLWHRRSRASMALPHRLRRGFRQSRGNTYYRRARGLGADARTGELPRLLAHSARYRCDVGLLDAVAELGKVAGWAEFAWTHRGRGGAARA